MHHTLIDSFHRCFQASPTGSSKLERDACKFESWQCADGEVSVRGEKYLSANSFNGTEHENSLRDKNDKNSSKEAPW